MATEQVVETVTEQVADHLEEVAHATRMINAKSAGIFLSGMGVGVVVGFFIGYRFNREKIRAEAFQESEAEVEKIREVYQQKIVAAEPKPSVDEVVEEKGYTVVEPAEDLRPLAPPVPVAPPSPHFVRPGVAKRHVDREKDKNDGWDYPAEVAKRTNERPYIIHQDEFAQNDSEYNQTTYTYYAVDDVLTDEEEQPVEDPDVMVGVENLRNFGHGADDFHVVYVRNDRLQLEFEICLLAASHAEEVSGNDQ